MTPVQIPTNRSNTNFSETTPDESRKPSSARTFSTLAEFFPHYLMQHQNHLNQKLHIAGTVGGMVCLGMGLFFDWNWLTVVLPLGYGSAWLGHFLFERNAPLTFRYPLWSLWADSVLVSRLLTGQSVKPISSPPHFHASAQRSNGNKKL